MGTGFWILLIGALVAYLLYEMTRAVATRWLRARQEIEHAAYDSEGQEPSLPSLPLRGQDMRVTGLMLGAFGGLGLAIAYGLGYGLTAVSAYWAGWFCLGIGLFLFIFGLCVRSLQP